MAVSPESVSVPEGSEIRFLLLVINRLCLASRILYYEDPPVGTAEYRLDVTYHLSELVLRLVQEVQLLSSGTYESPQNWWPHALSGVKTVCDRSGPCVPLLTHYFNWSVEHALGVVQHQD
jgi:hypothetical protein